ncbi:MAG TPA: metallophosphoesterase family protein [Bacteroidales bacterium]|nr:metallophosphoesterase family protein [Bacteroidales bacterium]
MNSKKILLISDTHGFFDESLWSYVNEADEVWHAGDVGDMKIIDSLQSFPGKLRGVFGNIDGGDMRLEFPEYQFLQYGALRVLIIHIAGRLGTYNMRVRSLISECRPDVLVCGHSHILKVGYDKRFNLLYMNPGACGHHGFHKIRTVLSFSIVNDKVHDINAIELGRRGRR